MPALIVRQNHSVTCAACGFAFVAGDTAPVPAVQRVEDANHALWNLLHLVDAIISTPLAALRPADLDRLAAARKKVAKRL